MRAGNLVTELTSDAIEVARGRGVDVRLVDSRGTQRPVVDHLRETMARLAPIAQALKPTADEAQAAMRRRFGSVEVSSEMMIRERGARLPARTSARRRSCDCRDG